MKKIKKEVHFTSNVKFKIPMEAGMMYIIDEEELFLLRKIISIEGSGTLCHITNITQAFMASLTSTSWDNEAQAVYPLLKRVK